MQNLLFHCLDYSKEKLKVFADVKSCETLSDSVTNYIHVYIPPTYFIKIPLLLIQSGCSGVRPFQIHHNILQLSLEPDLRLLQAGSLRLRRFNCFLRLLEPGCKLLPGGIKKVDEEKLLIYFCLSSI